MHAVCTLLVRAKPVQHLELRSTPAIQFECHAEPSRTGLGCTIQIAIGVYCQSVKREVSVGLAAQRAEIIKHLVLETAADSNKLENRAAIMSATKPGGPKEIAERVHYKAG
jgi:hypothetical protein